MIQPINWHQFGLKKNPYDTRPLVEGDALPLEKAFIGRKRECQFLDAQFQSADRLCMAVCGNTGVGKTSLINYYKYRAKQKSHRPLFSFRREIEANEYILNKTNFLIEIIGSVLQEIQLLDPSIMKDPLMKRLRRMVDMTQPISFGGGVSLFHANAHVERGGNLDGPLHVSIATIEHYFYSLISFIRTHKIAKRRYNGLIVHINNLDILLSHALTTKLVMHFLQEMRDILQTSHVYFFFLGPTTLFQFVYSEPRIHSAFCHSPLLLEPLTKKDIVHALNERMRLLQSDDVKQYIKPFEDRVIYSLYALYEGDLRSIMSALNDILSQCEGPIHNTLTSQNAMWLLGKERWSRIEHTIRFTKKRKEFLLYLIHQGGLVHYDQIIHQFQTTPANASAYYIQPFREVGILTMNEYSNKKWITLTAEYSPLMLWAQSKSIEELFKKSQRQPIHV